MKEDDTCSVALLQEITPTQGICKIIEKQYFQGFIYYRNICTLQITDQSTKLNKLELTSCSICYSYHSFKFPSIIATTIAMLLYVFFSEKSYILHD